MTLSLGMRLRETNGGRDWRVQAQCLDEMVRHCHGSHWSPLPINLLLLAFQTPSQAERETEAAY